MYLSLVLKVIKRGFSPEVGIGSARLGMCMIKIFRGGKGWWMGWGVAVKDA